MNILLVYKEADIATYKMLEGLSKLEDFNIYIASPPIVYRQKRSMGIVHLWICRSLPRSSTGTLFVPCAKSSRLIRSTLSTHRVVPVYQNALFASIGTGRRISHTEVRRLKLKRFDPTYYLGILNPAVEHVVCETKDIEEYLSRFIARKKTNNQHKAI